MNYRYGFVLKNCNDYVRKVDLEWMTFLTLQECNKLRISFEKQVRAKLFIMDDVNADRVEAFVNLLKENNVEVGIVHTNKWKPLPDKPELYE